jgi:hypothetical protein
MKVISFLLAILSSTLVWADACPTLQGRYYKCYSEIRNIKGEYVVDQHQENNYDVFNVQYIDDETGETREDVFKTNNEVISRKETLPRVGVRVRIEGRARCEGNAMISDGQVYFMGAHVGSYVTKIFLEGKNLKSTVDGGYLGRDVHKRIACELKE